VETLLALAISLTSPSAVPCSLEGAFFGPGPGESVAVATATGRTQRVLAIPPPVAGRQAPPTGGTTVAHEVVVFMATPSDAGLGTWDLLIPGDTVLAVPWELDEACDPAAFDNDEWVPADGQLVIRAQYVRRDDGGRRIVDVFGPLNGYPYQTYDPVDVERPQDRDQWLPAFDFFRLLSAAPKLNSDQPRAAQLQSLENAYRTGPTNLLDRFPGPQMLQWVRAWAAGG